jgi:hypothetical protein
VLELVTVLNWGQVAPIGSSIGGKVAARRPHKVARRRLRVVKRDNDGQLCISDASIDGLKTTRR